MTVFVLAHASQCLAASPVESVVAISCAPGNSRVVGIVTRSNIWISMDKGATWRRETRFHRTNMAENMVTSSAASEFLNDVVFDFDSLSDVEIDEEETGNEDEDDSDNNDDDENHIEDDFERNASFHGSFVSKTSDPQEVILAVGDSGEFALWDYEHVSLSMDGKPCKKLFRMNVVLGMHWDFHSRLWIVGRNEVLLVIDGSIRQRWLVPLARDGFIDGEDNSFWVPCLMGVLQWKLDSPFDANMPISIPSVTAIGKGNGKHLVAIVNGKIGYLNQDETFLSLGIAPREITSIAEERNGHFLLKDESGKWYLGTVGRWTILDVSTAAVSPDGQLWLGTDGGVRMADDFSRGREFSLSPLGEWGNVLGQGDTYGERILGKSSCGKSIHYLLPTLGVYAGMGGREGGRVGLEHLSEQTRLKKWRYAGVHLTWKFGVRPVHHCNGTAQVKRLFLERRREKIRQLLWRKQELDFAIRSATTPVSRIYAQIELEIVTEVLSRLTGKSP